MTLDLDEGWYSQTQITMLKSVAASVVGLEGMCIEVGCWKGNSTIAIAQSIPDGMICAIDTWEGSVDENPNHDTVRMAREQPVMDIFKANIRISSVQDSVMIFKMDWRVFFSKYQSRIAREGIRFLHIDGAHDYQSVKDNIDAALPYMVNLGVMCGDDIATAHKGRDDLKGGVERAVSETLVGYSQFANFWYWRKRI